VAAAEALQLYAQRWCSTTPHKTTIYDMPMFVVCVPTNVGNFNVATFLLSDERQQSIAGRLNQII